MTKGGVTFGVGLFVLGSLGEAAVGTVFGAPTGWGALLLADLELAGVAIASAAPLLFGIVLPLTEYVVERSPSRSNRGYRAVAGSR